RLKPKDKSLSNRQRFLKRAREELKRSIKEQVKIGKIADIDGDQSVGMPVGGTREPRFQQAADSGRRDYVLPGNREYAAGDRIPKQGQGGGAGGTEPSIGDSEDDFRFVLLREAVLDPFF